MLMFELVLGCLNFLSPCNFVMQPQLGPFFVLKFARSQGFGARFLQPFPKSLMRGKYYSKTKWHKNSR